MSPVSDEVGWTGTDDRSRLIEFTHEYEKFVKGILDKQWPTSDTSFMPQSVHEAIRGVWIDVEHSFNRVRSAIAAVNEKKLITQGLTGDQLAAKLAAWKDSCDSFHSVSSRSTLRRSKAWDFSAWRATQIGLVLLNSILDATLAGKILRELLAIINIYTKRD